MQQLYENKNLKLEDLTTVRQNLRIQIENQQTQVLESAKGLASFKGMLSLLAYNKPAHSPISLLASAGNKKNKFSFVDGMVMGYKMIRNVRRMFRR